MVMTSQNAEVSRRSWEEPLSWWFKRRLPALSRLRSHHHRQSFTDSQLFNVTFLCCLLRLASDFCTMVRWLPLESNPAVMNKFMAGLGVPESWTIHDVYGLDEEMLGMVPKPVGAIILLYPFSDKQEDFKKQQEEEQESSGSEIPEGVYFMKQFVGNACGTLALIHAVANNRDKIELADGALKGFLEKTESMNPEERGHALEADNGISKAHEESAQEGQTEAPDREAHVNEHFVAFVHIDGKLFEFDGRRKFPIDHGSSSADTLLGDAAKVCRQYMDRDPDESRFAVVALACSE